MTKTILCLKCILILFSIVIPLSIAGGAIPPLSEGRTLQQPDDSTRFSKYPHNLETYQLTFGFANDNFITIRSFEPFLKVGKDDFVTFRSWLHINMIYKGRPWRLNIHQDILTNKKADYRTDLFSVFPTTEWRIRRSMIRLGIGVVSRGNYGGDFIQSGYHDLRDFTTVDLPYTRSSSTGILLHIAGEHSFSKSGSSDYCGSVINSFRTGPGPSSFRMGVNYSLTNPPSNRLWAYQFQLNIGYVSLYEMDELLSPMFGSGFNQAAMVEVSYKNHYLISIWLSRNQYGRGQTHFGSSLGYAWSGLRFGKLADILYP